MSTARVILDSDDEGSDTSPHKLAPELEDLFSSLEAPKDPTHAADSFETTDSSFFRNIYNEHRVPTSSSGQDQHGDLGKATDLPRKSAATVITSPVDGKKAKLKRLDLGTSITDPVPASHKAKVKAAVDLDFTQITTPREERGSRPEDPWAIPSSPPVTMGYGDATGLPSSGGRSRSKISKTYGKRSRTFQSSPPPNESLEDVSRMSELESHDNGSNLAEDGPHAAPRGNSQVRNTPRSAQQPSASSFAATDRLEEPAVSNLNVDDGTRMATGGEGSEVASALLYVSPVALTASQKQEYSVIPPSSGPGQQDDVALPSFTNPADLLLHKSSGATTIAYTTPSEFASSSRRADPLVEPNSNRKRKLRPITEEVPPSSPDVLSITPETVKMKRARLAHGSVPSSEAGSPISTRGTKSKSGKSTNTSRNAFEDLPLQEDHFESHSKDSAQGSSTHKPSRRRSNLNARGVDRSVDELYSHPVLAAETSALTTETWVMVDSHVSRSGSMDPVDGEGKPAVAEHEDRGPRKRGRKRKETHQAMVLEDTTSHLDRPPKEAAQANSNPEESGTPGAKRKRGRPRKVEKQQPAELPTVVDEPADTNYEEPAYPDAHRGLQAQDDATKALDCPRDADIDPPSEPKKRGRKKNKQKTGSPKEVPHSMTESGVLGDISGNSSAAIDVSVSEKSSTDVAQETDLEVKENSLVEKKQVKDPTKALGSAQSGKVLYRVGLSKRSRIAPLLKSLRK
ncbi:hypothetical protein GQ53DRAFT_849200 [Thozetella sp. PMI_491]|nr:hypothetical protein GQ53DRAFT_849200 [Thozetella sp. PMI_491]